MVLGPGAAIEAPIFRLVGRGRPAADHRHLMARFRERIRLLHQPGVAGEMAGADQADVQISLSAERRIELVIEIVTIVHGGLLNEVPTQVSHQQ